MCDICVVMFKFLNYFGFGYYGGSMLVVEILVVLYGVVMKIDFVDLDWLECDYFVLLKGYVGFVLYSILVIKGYFLFEELNMFN